MPGELPGEEHATPLSRPYWQGLHDGRLVLQRCLTCGGWQHYPRRICRACWGTELEFTPVPGDGALVAAALSHRTPKPELRDRLPMSLGLVRLDEGPVLLARIEPSVGSGAKVAFSPAATLHSGLLTFGPYPPNQP
jgi:uncharacterized OB-fold protein